MAYILRYLQLQTLGFSQHGKKIKSFPHKIWLSNHSMGVDNQPEQGG